MSALRDLVGAGGGACAAPDERAGSSNPMARFADAVLGDRKGKHPEMAARRVGGGDPGGAFADQFLSQQRLRENLLGGGDGLAADAGFSALPGNPAPGLAPGLAPGAADVAEFMRFREAQHQNQNAAAAGPASLAGFAQPPGTSPLVSAHPAVRAALRSAVADARGMGPAAQPGAHPPLPALSPTEKTVIRNRSAIMARHLRAEAGEAETTARLAAALADLGVDPAPEGAMDGPRTHAGARGPPVVVPTGPEAAANSRLGWAREFAAAARGGAHAAAAAAAPPTAAAWANEFRGRARLPPPSAGATPWAEEFSGVKQSSGTPEAWAGEFAGERARDGADGWASEFARERGATSERAAGDVGLTAAQAETASQSARLAETLRANPDPKFQNSQFLNFVSRMSRGEIVVDEDGLAETGRVGAEARATGDAWAGEFASERARDGTNGWASEFASGGTNGWASEFANQTRPVGPVGPGATAAAAAADPGSSSGADAAHRWADEFASVPEEWAAEFEAMRAGNPDFALENVWDRVAEEGAALRAAERSQYRFVDPNPYLGRADALAIGRDLFRRGVLSEAALALEAAVRADPASCEGWRLLGTVHAENDDDVRAIAAMTRANEADPGDPEVLLSLGVSHTNELDQAEATAHMRRWLREQPRFAALEAEYAANERHPETPAACLELFRRAAELAPGDADVRAVLGVLAHLNRAYDEAIAAFEAALEINPSDYSLWNKLGATQANSARSAEAMRAYQRALDLKPNYVRAWANMGIGFANQGKYAESCAYYVRALSLNPNAESVWGYLRISLGCAGRIELMEAVDAKNLEALEKAFPL